MVIDMLVFQDKTFISHLGYAHELRWEVCCHCLLGQLLLDDLAHPGAEGVQGLGDGCTARDKCKQQAN